MPYFSSTKESEVIIIYTTITDVDVATFADDEYDMPLKSLIVDIIPVQSGSGDPTPDNIRSISGRTGTVYGGTLDVTTGLLTVTHKVVTWPKSSSSVNTVTTRDSDNSTAFWGNIGTSEGCNVYGTGSKALCSAAKKSSIVLVH